MTTVDFRLVGNFSSPLFSAPRSVRRTAANTAETSVVLLVPQRNFLFLGLTDGKICGWETDKFATPPRTNQGATDHKGGIRSLVFVEDLWQGVLFSGSADRSIKMWDLSEPHLSITCVHSLYGHGGTILALEYGSHMLLSSSSDGTLCIWKDQSPTKLLRFPVYSVRQKIVPEVKTGLQNARQPKDTWFLSLAIREGEVPSIFAGDSEGYIHIYKPDSLAEGDLYMLVWKRQIHSLGILKILTIPMESFLITLSFDQKFKTMDSMSGQVAFEDANPCGVVFGGCAWDEQCQDAVVADEKGNVGFYNVYTETCVSWKNVIEEPITQIHYETAARRLLLLSPHCLRVYDVVRSIKFTDLTGHEGPVVAVTSKQTPQGGILFTAAMDNTIRLWDAETLESIKVLKEKKHEVTAMVYLPQSNVIITGHENSELKMWSVDCPVEANLRTVSGQSAHSNTISALTSALVYFNTGDQGSPRRSIMGQDETSSWEMLVAGSYDCQISFWKVTVTSDGSAMANFERVFVAHDEEDDEVLAVAYSSAAESVFTGGNAGIIRQWAVGANKKLKAELIGHEEAVTCFAVDANFLFSGSEDFTVRIWETSQGYQLKSVQVHNIAVQDVLVIPESGLAVTCGFDGRVIVWDPQIGRRDVREVKSFEQPEELRTLAYLESTKTLLVGCESGRIITFPLPASAFEEGPPPSASPEASQQEDGTVDGGVSGSGEPSSSLIHTEPSAEAQQAFSAPPKAVPAR
eukprot:CAMPEP_0206537596 /NCGR_PEP_ID=MMETSP0325_2-20121206/7400_1 /ASSEMBLY_ACC=CAM_ASM_000347 /TAXON_ID=2866 /ORGANISM="Crypthecodinium cohnii, Strain Seligo" /LENGTH=744 /DNA_ID=CAMNT_0054034951 /DNA_START=1 /DNA_END=2236 /DNA_ORIENTATION=-